jgi:hypothetical protein
VLLGKLAAELGGEQILQQLVAEHEKDGAAYIQLTLWIPQRVHIPPPRRSGRQRCPTIQQTRRLTTNVLRVNQIERFPYHSCDQVRICDLSSTSAWQSLLSKHPD